MSDRIVAELLGWEPHPATGPYADWLISPVKDAPIVAEGPEITYGNRCREVRHISEAMYTVDDLLTWLADKGWCTDIERLIDHETPVFVTLRSNRHRDIFDLPMFTTALAACEAAVRAVAEMP